MEVEPENSRPNIRIQISNHRTDESVEKMDVDNDQNENEEGEITDDDNMKEETGSTTLMNKVNAVFTTGINIFDKREQEKLQERAKRFALKPDEIHSFSEQDLQDLHESLGINPTNESEVKFETVHLLGLGDMSAEDIVDYFANYAPEGIEWIDKNSCNIVWLDNLSAARAIHFKSRVVKGMPAREPKDIFPKEFLDDVDETEQENGQSILIKNQYREIELQNEIGEIILPKKKVYPPNAVDISEITGPIPPGYWRLGLPHPKTNALLMRFGLVTDKLPFKSEKCSKYYKKLGSTQAQRGVISESKKKELRSIFERNKELNQKKNPWGSLAKNWDKDRRFREREPVMYNLETDDIEIVEVKNPKLKARLGTKRKLSTEEEKPIETEEADNNDNDDTKSNENPKLSKEKKIVKFPRMKMYADEEEENQKRRKILMKIKKQTEEIDRKENERDLRNMLGPANRIVLRKDIPPIENIDLGTRLKNRNQRMVFAVSGDPYDDILMDRPTLMHRERIKRSVLVKPMTFEERDRERISPERHTSRESLHMRFSRHRTPVKTLHSDRVHSRTSHRRRRTHSRESRRDHHTRSKVAVVVRNVKKPTVASTIWSKVKKSSETEESSSESDSDSNNGSEDSSSEESSSSGSSSSSSSESKSDSDESDESDTNSRASNERIQARNPDRPGFDHSRLIQKMDHKSPLKITTTNEHFANKRTRKL